MPEFNVLSIIITVQSSHSWPALEEPLKLGSALLAYLCLCIGTLALTRFFTSQASGAHILALKSHTKLTMVLLKSFLLFAHGDCILLEDTGL